MFVARCERVLTLEAQLASLDEIEEPVVSSIKPIEEPVLETRGASESVRTLLRSYKGNWKERYGSPPKGEEGGILGVSFHLLKQIANVVGEDRPTFEVAAYITAETAKTGLSFVDSFPEAAPRRAQYFVSHAWGIPFSTTLAAIKHHHDRICTKRISQDIDKYAEYRCEPYFAASIPADNAITEYTSIVDDSDPDLVPYYWIDICSKNQHKVNGSDTELELANCVALAKSVIVVIDKWPQPTLYTRIWCIFEIWTAIRLHKKLEFAVSEDVKGFLLSFRYCENVSTSGGVDSYREEVYSYESHRFEPTAQMLDEVAVFSAKNAQATFEADRARILAYIESHCGVEALDAAVVEGLKREALSLFSHLNTEKSEVQRF